MRLADVVIINKIDSAAPDGVQAVRAATERLNPRAIIMEAASPIKVEDPSVIRGKRVLVIEDGPTLTHGGMTFGAGTLAAKKYGAAAIVDPRPYLNGKIVNTFRAYPGIGLVLPAMGYGDEQLHDLETTIASTDCDAVVVGTPIDLRRAIKITQPSTRVFYDLQEIGTPDLHEVLEAFIERKGLSGHFLPGEVAQHTF